MYFYAYKPDANGKEPVGCSDRIIRRDLKSERYFVTYARRILGDSVRVFRVNGDNFYNDAAFVQIYPTK